MIYLKKNGFLRKSVGSCVYLWGHLRRSVEQIVSLPCVGPTNILREEDQMIPNDATCSSCRWWKSEWLVGRTGWGICELTGTYDGNATFPETFALAVSEEFGGRGNANLETRGDFVCNQWLRP